MHANLLPHKKRSYTWRIIIAMLIVGALVYYVLGSYKSWWVLIDIKQQTWYTLGDYLDLAEELKESTQPKVQSLIEDILEIKDTEKYLKSNGVDYKAWEYLLYTTWGTTYKIGVDIVE